MTHTVGNWYKIDGEFYILAQVAEYAFCLIGLDGNRWSNPIRLECISTEGYPLEISDEDFKKISDEWKDVVSVDIVVMADTPMSFYEIVKWDD